jgi:hypothetical protein
MLRPPKFATSVIFYNHYCPWWYYKEIISDVNCWLSLWYVQTCDDMLIVQISFWFKYKECVLLVICEICVLLLVAVGAAWDLPSQGGQRTPPRLDDWWQFGYRPGSQVAPKHYHITAGLCWANCPNTRRWPVFTYLGLATTWAMGLNPLVQLSKHAQRLPAPAPRAPGMLLLMLARSRGRMCGLARRFWPTSHLRLCSCLLACLRVYPSRSRGEISTFFKHLLLSSSSKRGNFSPTWLSRINFFPCLRKKILNVVMLIWDKLWSYGICFQ